MIVGIERDGERVGVRVFGGRFHDWRRWVIEARGRYVYEVDGRLIAGLRDARHGWQTQRACRAAASICVRWGRLLTRTLTASRRVA